MSKLKLTLTEERRFTRTCRCHHPTILICPVHEHGEWITTVTAAVMHYWSLRLKPALDPVTARKWADAYDVLIIQNGIDAANRFVAKRTGEGIETDVLYAKNYAAKVMKRVKTCAVPDDTAVLISMPCSPTVN